MNNNYEEIISRFNLNIEDFDEQKLSILKHLDDNLFNISPLINKNLSLDDFKMIAYALENGIDYELFNNNIFDKMQIEQLVRAKKEGIDISGFSNSKYSAKQMKAIINGLKNKVDISKVSEENLSDWELEKRIKKQDEYIKLEKAYYKLSYLFFPKFFNIFKKKLWNRATKDKHAEYFDQKEEENLELEDYIKYEMIEERNEIVADYYENDLKNDYGNYLVEAGVEIDKCNFDRSNPTELDIISLETFTFNIEDVLWEFMQTDTFLALKEKFNQDLIERIRNSEELRIWAIQKYFYQKGKNNFKKNDVSTWTDFKKLTYSNNDDLDISQNPDLPNIKSISNEIYNDIEDICNDGSKLDLINKKLQTDLQPEDIKLANVRFRNSEIIEYLNDKTLQEAYEIGISDSKKQVILSGVKDDNNTINKVIDNLSR